MRVLPFSRVDLLGFWVQRAGVLVQNILLDQFSLFLSLKGRSMKWSGNGWLGDVLGFTSSLGWGLPEGFLEARKGRHGEMGRAV